jgi:hypothetical protein
MAPAWRKKPGTRLPSGIAWRQWSGDKALISAISSPFSGQAPAFITAVLSVLTFKNTVSGVKPCVSTYGQPLMSNKKLNCFVANFRQKLIGNGLMRFFSCHELLFSGVSVLNRPSI